MLSCRHTQAAATEVECCPTGILPAERAQTPRITTAVDALTGCPAAVRETARIATTAVRWPAFTVGGVTVDGEGLWLRPRTSPAIARIIVLPDADHSPEYVAGCVDHSNGSQDQYALRLAEAGFEVLVMSLIDRQDTFSGTDAAQATAGGAAEGTFRPVYTNQPHREWLHRAAYQMVRGCGHSFPRGATDFSSPLSTFLLGAPHHRLRSPNGDRSSRCLGSIAINSTYWVVWIWRGRFDCDAFCCA